ncbi:ABC transporter protein [Rutstroemia sp. NJR-2017a WRK4]|nr:ABC transporter protein [Rutstroemia sp. NJR-2017a WRK4]
MASFRVQGGEPNAFHINFDANITQCRRIWDPVNAHFESCFIPVVAAVPAFISALVVLGLLISLLPLERLTPSWLQSFVTEPDEKTDELEPRPPRRFTRHTWYLLGTSIVGFGLDFASIFHPSLQLQMIFPTVSWATACFLVVILRPIKTPKHLLVLYGSIFLSQYFVLLDRYSLLHREDMPLVLSWASSIVAIWIILIMPLRDPTLSTEGISPAFSPPNPELRSPEDNLTLWQFMTVSWMAPLMSTGKARQLNEEDVWTLSYQFQHRILHEKFRSLKGSVLRRLIDVTGIDLVIMAVLGIIGSFTGIASPLLLQKILASMENPLAPRQATLTYALIALAIRLLDMQCYVFAIWYGRRAYERSRGVMITMLYEKTLSRKAVSISTKPKETADNGHSTNGSNGTSNGGIATTSKTVNQTFWRRIFSVFWSTVSAPFVSRSKEPEKKKELATMGKILNIMKFWEFSDLIIKPLELILAIIAALYLLSWSCLIAAVTIVIGQAINALVIKVLIYYEKQRRVATDGKLHKTTQLVDSIRHLRWYGWQEVWLQRIMESRQAELVLFVITAIWRITMGFVLQLSGRMFPVAAFFIYCVWVGKPLRIDIAFPALQLFSIIEEGFQTIPGLITTLLNARISMERIEEFMQEPDKVEGDSSGRPEESLTMTDASFAWPGATEPVLQDLTMSFPAGLSLVYGEVGAGKTALLQALLGELDHLSGTYSPAGDVVGYCAQTPWLQSMSIRDNILFAAPYHEARYRKVLDACALIPDMANFKNGDLSLIGENGIGLSGGQRARVALARAVYSNAKILFLDDPLSALDHQTAESIVKKCLTGSLVEGRIVVLVTHRTELCQGIAKQIIRISHGRAEIFDPEAVPSEVLNEAEEEVDGDEKETEDQTAAAIPEKFMEDEHREHGGVRASVYWDYIKAGTIKNWAVMLVFMAIFRLSTLAEAWFLKSWGEAYEGQRTPSKDPLSRLPSPEVNIRPWLVGYFLLILSQSVIYVFREGTIQLVIYTAGKAMFITVMSKVVHATFRFYDVTPVGRLMNRLTSDINIIDGNLASHFTAFSAAAIVWLSSLVVIGSITPTFLAFAVVLTITLVKVYSLFLPSSQSLRRLEMVSLTPLLSNFGQLTDGLGTIRAFCAQARFQEAIIVSTDGFQKMDHFYWSLQAWLICRFNVLSSVSTFLMTFLAVYTGVSPGLTAFVLSAAQRFVSGTSDLCRVYGQMQMDFVSVERIVELIHLDQEPAGEIDPPAYWPRLGGDIVFEDVSIRYAPHLDPSLKNISLTIKGGSTTALIGRTGSGKSTLALSLLATTLPCTGRILIDGIDISKVKIDTLRKRVTFLAQEPVLFPGTMRMNLDPTNEYSDEECASVLSKIALRHNWTLDMNIDTGGKNLSQGQRQLVGLARALLRRSSIIIMDEATASIDKETAGKIQELIREELKESTVVTIAHRVEAVKGVDWCVVLEKGEVKEFGEATKIGRMDMMLDTPESGSGAE